jgi:hypothetical protein
MNHEKMLLVLYIIFAIMMMKRIFQWSRQEVPNEERKRELKTNLILVISYSVFILLPLIFFSENTPQYSFFPDLGKEIMFVFWIFIFSAHLFFLWIYAEIKMWKYHSEKRKNHI